MESCAAARSRMRAPDTRAADPAAAESDARVVNMVYDRGARVAPAAGAPGAPSQRAQRAGDPLDDAGTQSDAGAVPTQARQALPPRLRPARPPPASVAELDLACARFEAFAPRLPPPPPPSCDCPGVYRRGRGAAPACGAPLAAARALPAGPTGPAVTYWRCSRAPTCAYTHVPPPRLCAPRLEAEWGGEAEFWVAPAAGAAECVFFCGGVRAVLAAAGLPNRVLAAGRAPAGGGEAVSFPLELYKRVASTLGRATVARSPLLRDSGAIPPGVLDLATGRRRAVDGSSTDFLFSRIPLSLRSSLLPFQAAGVRYALDRGGRALIADEMGVGKTVQALAVAAAFRSEWPLLIVCPASLRLVWAEEVERWLGGVVRPADVAVVDCSAAAPPPPPRAGSEAATATSSSAQRQPRVIITSYEMLARLSCAACTKDAARAAVERSDPRACAGPPLCLAARPAGVLVLDESHALRTTAREPDARATEAAAAAAGRAARCVMLTGTPSLCRPYDLYRQVAALAPRLLPPTRHFFAERYCAARWVGGCGDAPRRLDVAGLAHAAELRAALTGAVMIRRLKREVADQLPPKRRQVVLLHMPKQGGGGRRARRLPAPAPAAPAAPAAPLSLAHMATMATAASSLPPRSPAASPPPSQPSTQPASQPSPSQPDPAAAHATSDAHRTAIAKLPSVVDWLACALGGGGGDDGGDGGGDDRADAAPSPTKTVVFAHHRDVMDGLAAALASKRVGFVRVDGGVDAVDRRAATARFRDDPEAWVALLSITAAGVGLDFSPAAAVVFAELPDEPALVAQAEARAHRRGAAAACINVYFLIARGTSDERRWRALDRGLARLAAVADGARGGRGGLAVHGVRDADAGVATPGGAAVEAAPPPPPPPPRPVQPPSHQAWPADPWWELSPHTGRLHAHGGPAGDAPLGLSAPLAELARGAGAAAAALAAAAAAPGGCGAPKFVTDSWAAAAAEAAGDVAEVRGAVRACLAGLVLRAPLAAEAAADAAAAAAGAVRGSTVRHDAPREPLPGVGVPPPGGALRSVSVARPRGGGVTVFTQVVDAAGKGLCLACGGLAPGTAAAPRPGAAVSSRSALFCAPSCDAEHATRTGGAAARRALFRVERGVCAACGLDAHALVAALRAVPRGGSGWLEQRLAVLQSLAPAFTGAAAARLASAAAAGHAWQADHTLAVHDGGGGCGLANLRTLCVPCHARVTAAQAGARAAAKRTRGGGGGRPPPPPPLRPRAPIVLDDDEEEGGCALDLAPPPAATRRPLAALAAAAGRGR